MPERNQFAILHRAGAAEHDRGRELAQIQGKRRAPRRRGSAEDPPASRTAPSREEGSPRRISTARLVSGTPRDSPFLVTGRKAMRRSRFRFGHCSPRSSLHRMPVSMTRATKCTSQVFRALRQVARSRCSSSSWSRRFRGRPCGGRSTSLQGLAGR